MGTLALVSHFTNRRFVPGTQHTYNEAMRYWRYEPETDELALWETRTGFDGWSLVRVGGLSATHVLNLTETEAQSLAIRRFGVPLPDEYIRA